jgi:hypothetical protein
MANKVLGMFAGGFAEKTRPPLYPTDIDITPLCSNRSFENSLGSSNAGSQRNRMNHYAIDEWVDFSRGLVTDGDGARMRAHLAAGCADCRHLSEFTTKLAHACSNTAAAQVPESALRMARAIFPVRLPDRPKRGSRIPIELIFDSFLVPAPVGLRATWQVGWQGLYRAGDCSVDVRIEPELKSARAAVIGQITNDAAPSTSMSNLPVSLRAGNLVVAETVSNRFGEFQMEYEERAQLKLCISLADARVIQVPLKKLTAEQPATQSRKISRNRTGEKR